MQEEVVILSIDNGLALVRNRLTKERNIPMNVLPSAAPIPRIGETWVIDNSSGYWNFDKILVPKRNTLTGDTLGIPALQELIALLVEEGYIDDATTSLLSTVPTGAIMPYVGGVAPSGWLLCDGTAVLRATYPALHVLMRDATTAGAYPYGAGNGTTTFNLPDLRGRVPLGRDAGLLRIGGVFNNATALGLGGGVETVTLTVTQMASHTHIQDSHVHPHNPHNHTQVGHFHTTPTGYDFLDVEPGTADLSIQAGTHAFFEKQMATVTPTINNTTSTGQSVTATNQNTGGGQPHQNMPPFLTVNYIVKT